MSDWIVIPLTPKQQVLVSEIDTIIKNNPDILPVVTQNVKDHTARLLAEEEARIDPFPEGTDKSKLPEAVMLSLNAWQELPLASKKLVHYYLYNNNWCISIDGIRMAFGSLHEGNDPANGRYQDHIPWDKTRHMGPTYFTAEVASDYVLRIPSVNEWWKIIQVSHWNPGRLLCLPESGSYLGEEKSWGKRGFQYSAGYVHRFWCYLHGNLKVFDVFWKEWLTPSQKSAYPLVLLAEDRKNDEQ